MNGGAFERVPLGMVVVDPRSIVGLNRTSPERLGLDGRLARLLESIRVKGWQDPFPDDLHLFLLLGGRYTVGSKGNIRAFAAKACDVPWIYARVDAILPHKLFTVSTLEQIERSSSTEFRHGLSLGQLAQFTLAAGFGC